MVPISKASCKDWRIEQLKDPVFATELRELELGYQIARLRIQRGFTQTQLAWMVGMSPSYISNLEQGSSTPRLPVIRIIARALDATIDIRIVPNE